MNDNRPVWQKLISSRKFWVLISASVMQIAGRYGLKIEQGDINNLLALHGLLMFLIGWEDAAEKRAG